MDYNYGIPDHTPHDLRHDTPCKTPTLGCSSEPTTFDVAGLTTFQDSGAELGQEGTPQSYLGVERA